MPITRTTTVNYDRNQQPEEEQYEEPPEAEDEGFDNSPAVAEKDAPKPAETGTPGTKSVLTPAKDSLPVAQVARQQPMEPGDPNADPGNPQDQIYSSAIAPERDPDKAWQEHAVLAINGLYPRLRNGEDYAVGRKSLEGDVELLAGEDKVDWGKVEEAARKLAVQNPYTEYAPKPPLHEGSDPGTASGEVPYRGRTGLMQEDTPSQVNPRSNIKIPTQPQGAVNQPRTFEQPTPPPDPYFDEEGNRR